MGDHYYASKDGDKDGIHKLELYNDEKFTLKYEVDEIRLAIVERGWNGCEPFYLECDSPYLPPHLYLKACSTRKNISFL